MVYGLMAVNWHERLDEWRALSGMSVAELARRSGVKVDTIHKWIAGKVEHPRDSDLTKVLSCLGNKSKIELFYGVQLESYEALRDIPMLQMRELGALRQRKPPAERWSSEEHFTISGSFSQDSIAVRIPDDANAPELRSGDIVVVDPLAPPVPGKYVLAVLLKSQTAMIRRYKPLTSGDSAPFKLLADNSHYPDEQVDDSNPGFVLGRVVKHSRDL